MFIDVFREGVASGEFRSGVAAGLVRDLVFGGIDHHISGFLYGRAKLDVENSTAEFMAILLAVIATPKTEPPDNRRFAALVGRLETIADRLENDGRSRAKNGRRNA